MKTGDTDRLIADMLALSLKSGRIWKIGGDATTQQVVRLSNAIGPLASYLAV